MEPESRYTLIGASVLSLIVIAVAGWLWLAGHGTRNDYQYYAIHFQSQSLEGLQVGSDVTMRGIKVGRVQRYSISRDNINRVDVVIRVDRETPVSVNTRAIVGRNLLTGIARIDLDTPGTPGPELAGVPEGEDYPVIAEGTSDLDQIADAMRGLAVRGGAVLDNLHKLLAEENQAELIGAVVAVRELAENVDARLARVDRALDGFTRGAAAIEDSSRRMTASLMHLADQGADAAARIAPLLEQGEKMLQAITHTAQALEAAGNGLADRLGSATDSSVLELHLTARELRRSSEQLSRVLERLQNPRAALFGPAPAQLGPGERTP